MNDFLRKQLALQNEMFCLGQRLGCQQTIDYLQVALAEEGFGEQRLWRVLTRMQELRKHFDIAFDSKNAEADVYREHLDELLAEHCSDDHPLVPFDIRYDYIKKVRY